MQLNFLRKILYVSVHRSKKSVAQIADELGISENYLYRLVSLSEDSPLNFPLHLAVPLMKSTKKYELLRYIAAECGFICSRVPRMPRNRLEESDLIYFYQNQGIRASEKLLKFVRHQTEENRKAAFVEIHKELEQSVGILKRLENWGQFKLFEEEQ